VVTVSSFYSGFADVGLAIRDSREERAFDD
jgi:hypothetical protein